MMLTAKALYEGQQFPKWYGLAYTDPTMGQAIAYPIPFHWFVRVGRLFWWAFLFPKARLAEQKKWDSLLEAEFSHGMSEGRDAERQYLVGLADALGTTPMDLAKKLSGQK